MTMTADQLMALVKQYVEACEALGLRRFDRHRDEDFKAARWEVVDGWRQIEAEVARLHAEATKADRLRQALQQIAQVFQSDLPARCQKHVQIARNALAQDLSGHG